MFGFLLSVYYVFMSLITQQLDLVWHHYADLKTNIISHILIVKQQQNNHLIIVAVGIAADRDM